MDVFAVYFKMQHISTINKCRLFIHYAENRVYIVNIKNIHLGRFLFIIIIIINSCTFVRYKSTYFNLIELKKLRICKTAK